MLKVKDLSMDDLEYLIERKILGTYKLRVGDWRVIYTVEGDVMIIQSVGHRREIYKVP